MAPPPLTLRAGHDASTSREGSRGESRRRSWSERVRPQRGSSLALGACVLALLSATLPGCRQRGSGACKGRSATQCAWEGATRDPDRRTEGPTPSGRRYTGIANGEVVTEWDRATQILGEAWTLMGEGVEGEAVVERVSRWCSIQPGEQLDAQPTWSCALTEPPRFEGREMTLEASADGIVALSAANLGEGEAIQLVSDAAEQWRALCTTDFTPYPSRGPEGEHLGCVLEEGPLLVLSRIKAETDSPLWQVSLTVLPAG